ncbi:hypothetical protein NOV72_05413 [Caballeronia novacaledonica]|uniref:Uncharacterized protein n=1 Tax=Caballeronia novacaledonica TaxID=1544861 RepID=A0A2U3IDB5_9BURK|nr:hypothetical protein [Caballeronia novacaledonica]SPB18214.1 hypothetical protein NOV72_05413 [Caballeronia novacaledonica]
MTCAAMSLRQVVEHWLGSYLPQQIRVVEFRNRRATHECYVRVSTMRSAGPVSLAFFRHEDGAWRVFPPGRERPAMSVYVLSA